MRTATSAVSQTCEVVESDSLQSPTPDSSFNRWETSHTVSQTSEVAKSHSLRSPTPDSFTDR